MRHGNKNNHLGRKKAHVDALMSNMASSLILSKGKKIETTVAKAKALGPRVRRPDGGALEPGSRLSEQGLAASLGVSRGPLREAIQRVGAEGLIEFQRNRGAFVREIALEDIEDMYEARVIIESMAARRAARWASEDQIAELSSQIDGVDTVTFFWTRLVSGDAGVVGFDGPSHPVCF